jgi:hypothetical protein|tara:strand:+ start:461 stop:631 length:171 start_codon:yes stop_codon:yes gene_type:complete
MSQDRNYKYDGKSRPSNAVYEKRWNEIFGNSVKVKDLKKLLKETNGTTKKTNRTTD